MDYRVFSDTVYIEKMYSDDNRPSEGQLVDMKRRLIEELENLI